jgi:integrase
MLPTRAAATRVLWELAENGHADVTHDDRFRALVLLAAFASLRWGEVTALKRRDIDLVAGTVRVRFAFTEQDNGKMLLGPPKSRAGRRTVNIPASIIPDITAHLAKYTKRSDDALVFTGIKGGPLRRSGFNKLTRWVDVVRTMGVPGLHLLSRHGARCRDCSRSVSPCRSPNPPYRSLGNGLSTVSAGQAGLGVGHGVGILLPR